MASVVAGTRIVAISPAAAASSLTDLGLIYCGGGSRVRFRSSSSISDGYSHRTIENLFLGIRADDAHSAARAPSPDRLAAIAELRVTAVESCKDFTDHQRMRADWAYTRDLVPYDDVASRRICAIRKAPIA